MNTPAAGPALEVSGVSRRFGGVHALTEVSLTLRSGQIHAICGENGAGKSTLMGVLAGSVRADAGTMRIGGRRYAPAGPLDGVAAGVGMVYQERSLLPNVSVAENICLGGRELRSGPLVRPGRLRRVAREVLRPLDPDIDVDRRVGTLSPAAQQIVEIAKALAGEPRVLILDEPTSSITIDAAARLFAILRGLRDSGLAIAYISHHLDEVLGLADRFTVLRDGTSRGEYPAEGMDHDRLVRLMTGREYSHSRTPTRDRDGAGGPALEVCDLRVSVLVRGVSFRVAAGEIVALTGLVGAGRSETAEAIFGVRRRDGGQVRVAGRRMEPNRPDLAVRRGLGMVGEDRKDGGLFLDVAISENIAAPNLRKVSRWGLVDDRGARRLAGEYLDSLRIRAPSTRTPVSRLSGGNQQKVLLAMWLATRPSVLVVDEPTRGVDIGAKDDIHQILLDLARRGTAILLVSSDQAEVHRLADRVLVMRRGRIVAELPGGAGEEEIVAAAAGTEQSTHAAGADDVA